MKKLLYPNILLTLALLFFSLLCLPIVFIWKLEQTFFAYVTYLVSAYMTVAVTAYLIRYAKEGYILLHKNPFLHKYLTDLDFKAKVSLYFSFVINLFYSLYTAVEGLYHQSSWFGAMAFYYIVLSIEFFLLLSFFHRKPQSLVHGFRKYRFCGYLLLALTVAIIIISFCIIYNGEAIKYPGYIIYVAAGYTFYNLGMAITNFIRYQKLKNPIYLASKSLTLATAFVSIFFLQTAMFTTFGDNSVWQKQMNIWTGSFVFLFVATMSCFMIWRGSKSITELLGK